MLNDHSHQNNKKQPQHLEQSSLIPNFSSVPRLTVLSGMGGGWWVGGWTRGTIQQRSSSLFYRRPLWADIGHGWGCLLFAVIHLPFPLPSTLSPTLQGALKDGFGADVVVRVMPASCELPAQIPVGPQGSWSCTALSNWSCAPRNTCGEVSSRTWFRKTGSFSQRQQSRVHD